MYVRFISDIILYILICEIKMKTYAQVFSELLEISEKSFYRWKNQDHRKLISLLEKYFTKEDIEEFLELGKVSKFEYFNFLDYQYEKKITTFAENLYNVIIHADYPAEGCIEFLAYTFYYLDAQPDYTIENTLLSLMKAQNEEFSGRDNFSNYAYCLGIGITAYFKNLEGYYSQVIKMLIDDDFTSLVKFSTNGKYIKNIDIINVNIQLCIKIYAINHNLSSDDLNILKEKYHIVENIHEFDYSNFRNDLNFFKINNEKLGGLGIK